MAVNYEDERFQQVEADKNEAISEIEKTYSGLIEQSDAYYQSQIDASKEWEEKQSQLQQEQTDFAIEQIEQQKEQEQKDYIKEQSGAYVDWQKQSNEYGAKSEEIAAGGMTNTGFAESSQTAMYNAYQNRVATARESYRLAVQNYNNAITQAQMQNNAALAEIAYQALQQQLELSLQGFQYKNQLILAKTDKIAEAEQQYYQRYQDVLAQINTENALAEQIRQYNASLAEQQRQYNTSLAEEQRQFNASLAAAGAGGAKITGGAGGGASNDGYTGKAAIEDAYAQGTIKGSGSSKPVVTPFVGSTYKHATAYLERYDVLKYCATDLISESKWNHLKKNGNASASVKNYSNYQAYLKAFCKAAVQKWG